MRFTTFQFNNALYAGIFHNGGYYTFCDLLGNDSAPESVLAFIQAYENKPLPDFSTIIAEKGLQPIPSKQVKLCAPIPMPFRNVICVGKNYVDHAKEVVQTGLSTQEEAGIPSMPVYFSKNANPAPGDNDVISLHSHFTRQVDYEVELLVIIGKKVKGVAPKEVEHTIFGYTIVNDVTARDIQTAHGQWYFGKSLDGFCPMGPHIVTRDEIPFPVTLDVSCSVNGTIRQASNTIRLIYDITHIISDLSQGMTLYPGDMIATGTPGGIGHAKHPPVYLQRGDVVECEIEKIGILTNRFE